MKNRYLVLAVIACMVLLSTSLIVNTSCAGQAPQAPATGATTAAATKAPQVYKFKMADYSAPTDDVAFGENWHDWWAKQVNVRTGGKVQIDVFHGETLVKAGDSLNALDSGIADISHLPVPQLTGRFPITEFLADSSALFGNGKLMIEVIDRLFQAGLMKEYDTYKPLYFSETSNSGANCLYTTKKKVTRLEDLKGLKIRARGAPSTRLVEGLGATPVNIAAAELYMAAERGLVDGIITPPNFFDNAKLYEVTKYRVDQGITGSVKVTVMPKKLWDQLPPDIQLVFLGLKPEQQIRFAVSAEANIKAGTERLIQRGGESYKLDPAEAERWKKIMMDITSKLAAELEAKGIPMKKVLDIIEESKPGYDL